MKAVKKILGIGLISVTVLSLSGCGFQPLPDDQRYSRVDSIKNQLNLDSAGQMISEKYSGDGVWSGSSYRAEFKGYDAFDNLKSQLEDIVTNCTLTETQFNCISENNPSIKLAKEEGITALILTDSLGGRDEN